MVKPIGWFESRSWWPLAASAGLLVVASAIDPERAYPSVTLTIVLQLVFMTVSSAAVVAFVGRAFLAEGSVGLLLLACGAVFLGLSGVVANAAAPDAVNTTITIHNLCVWSSAVCHFVGILLVRRWRIDRDRNAVLGLAILAALLLIGLCVVAARSAWLPPFFVQGRGGTLTRQMVLGSAVVAFAVSGIALLRDVAEGEADYRRWYGLGLLAVSLGLVGVMVQRVHSGVVGWIGVVTQLLGGVYLLAAAWSAMKSSAAGAAPTTLSSPPGSAPMRYVLALAFVLAATALRLLLFPQLDTASPYILFFPAVVLSALYCGRGPTLVAALAAVVFADVLWVEPAGAIRSTKGRDVLLATLFLVNSAVIVAVSESLRKAQRRSVIAEFEAAAAHEREALAALVEAGRARLDDALRAARMVAWEYDTRTDRIAASSNLASLFGLADGTTLEHARDGMNNVHPHDVERHRATVRAAIEHGGAYTSLFRFVRPRDGKTMWIEERARALPGDDGRTARLVGTSSDVTERELAAQRLQDSMSERMRVSAEREVLLQRMREQDARKDEFLATLAHELRNPLAPLRSGLRLLDQPRPDAAAWQKARAMMERQVDLLVRLIDDLLDLARINRGKIVLRRAPVALADVVQRATEISQPLIEAGGHALAVELPREPVMLDADEMRLAQVFSNLLNNAAKYSEPGGRIVLSAALGAALPDGGGREVEVRVRDEGIGIAPEMVSHVFDLFAQADPSLEKSQGGLGIGLTLARTLVELHGGSVQVRSAGLGHGSEFVITLPVLLEHAPAPPRSATTSAPTAVSTTAATNAPGTNSTTAATSAPSTNSTTAAATSASSANSTTTAATSASSLVSAAPATNAATTTSIDSRRILVADDNVDAADSLAELLRFHGHDVRTVYDGRSAIEQGEAYRPELVLLDLGMPGMSGLDACREMRAHDWGRRARIVAVTGWGDARAQRLGRDAGFDDWMTKPVDDAALQQMLNECPQPFDPAPDRR